MALYKASNFDKTDERILNAITTAIKLGYRHLDGAELYNTEPEVGIAIKESGVLRKDFFITTKVIINIKDIPSAIDASLENSSSTTWIYILFTLLGLPQIMHNCRLLGRKWKGCGDSERQKLLAFQTTFNNTWKQLSLQLKSHQLSIRLSFTHTCSARISFRGPNQRALRLLLLGP